MIQLLTSLSAGGVKLISANQRITVDNTLDERLRLLEEKVGLMILGMHSITETKQQMLPEIRHELFGINENRKFYT